MDKCLLNCANHIVLSSEFRIPEREICFAITAYPGLSHTSIFVKMGRVNK
jgi:hypothetical protein